MRTLKYIISLSFLLGVIVSCQKETLDQRDFASGGDKSKGTITISFTSNTKANADVALRYGTLFIFDVSGKVTQKVDINSASSVKVETYTGTYYIWAIFNVQTFRTGTYATMEDVESVVIPFSDVERWYLPVKMTVDGEDNTVSVSAGQNTSVELTGKVHASKLRVKKIVNAITEETIPDRPDAADRNICIQSFYVVNAPKEATIDGQGIPSSGYWNATGLTQYDNTNSVVYRYSGQEIPAGGSYDVPDSYSVFCFPSSDAEHPVILDVWCWLGYGGSRNTASHYCIPIGNVREGMVYTVEQLTLYKKGGGHGEITPSSSVYPSISVSPWTEKDGAGYNEDQPSGYSLDYTLDLGGFQTPGHLHFNSVHGATSVTSSKPSTFAVVGSGRDWELSMLKTGTVKLTITDGEVSEEVTVNSVGPITWSWEEGSSETIYRYTRAGINATYHGDLGCDDPYGMLDITINDTHFFPIIKAGKTPVVPIGPVQHIPDIYLSNTGGETGKTTLTIYDDNSSADIPVKIVNWPASYLSADNVHTDSDNTATVSKSTEGTPVYTTTGGLTASYYYSAPGPIAVDASFSTDANNLYYITHITKSGDKVKCVAKWNPLMRVTGHTTKTSTRYITIGDYQLQAVSIKGAVGASPTVVLSWGQVTDMGYNPLSNTDITASDNNVVTITGTGIGYMAFTTTLSKETTVSVKMENVGTQDVWAILENNDIGSFNPTSVTHSRFLTLFSPFAKAYSTAAGTKSVILPAGEYTFGWRRSTAATKACTVTFTFN